MKAEEFIGKVKSGEVDIVEYIHKVIEECKKINNKYHYFNKISEELALKQAENIKKNPQGKLAGLPVSIKDCICVKGVETRAGSAILNGYKPEFNATAVKKIIQEGAIIIGKTGQDEFGFGSFSTNMGKGFKKPLNPFDKERCCGGSSGGCGGIAQKASFPHISLGESTGGSIVNPASFCGIYGLCPTYGRVSRYGLIDYGNSLDKIGPIAKHIEDIALMQRIISGFDKNESTSLNTPVDDYSAYIGKDVKGMKIGVIDFGVSEDIDEPVRNKTQETIDKLNAQGVKTEKVSLPFSKKYGIPTYFLIAASETSTNLAKYCGMRYGASSELNGSSFNEYFTKVRSEYLGDEAKRRIILGTFARMAGQRDAYYIKAAKIRTKVIEEYKRLFKTYDTLISPVINILPPKFDEIDKLSLLQTYTIDALTVSPNLAGLPHLSIPTGMVNKLPSGVMLTGDHLQEGKLIQLAAALRKE